VPLGTISKKLTLYAALDGAISSHTFVAIVANTQDNIFPTSLLMSNLQTYGVATEDISLYSVGISYEVIDIVEAPQVTADVPVQQSSITSSSVSAPDKNMNVTIKVTGNFIEKILNVDVNGRGVSGETWTQDATTVTIKVPATASGKYLVQLYNHSAPILDPQSVMATS
jgi:hypothetical protein